MNYKETEVSKMLKKYNDLIYSTVQELSKTKSQSVRDCLQSTLKLLNKSKDEYILKRKEEINTERMQAVTLSNGYFVTKGYFIDTQQQYELDDEETENFIIIRYDNKC